MPNPRKSESAAAPTGFSNDPAGANPARLSGYGQLLTERASMLADIRIGGSGYRDAEGTAISLKKSTLSKATTGFLRHRTFAVVSDEGGLYLRLPASIADDLIETGMALPRGKDLWVKPPRSDYQAEISWQLLLHAYWLVTQADRHSQYTILSEHILRHINHHSMSEGHTGEHHERH
jgi:hypothetical protein